MRVSQIMGSKGAGRGRARVSNAIHDFSVVGTMVVINQSTTTYKSRTAL
jgi:hypothetical protein